MSKQLELENAINASLTGESKTNAVDFSAYLDVNGMEYKEGQVSYNDTGICHIYIDGSDQIPGPWTVWSDDSAVYENIDVSPDEQTRDIAWKHANVCGNCGGNCSPGTQKTIFGKEFNNICTSTFMFTDPNAEELECIKKLLEIRIKSI